MTRIKLTGGSYESQSVNADCQRTVNWYPEKIESGDGNTDVALYPSPGTKLFADLTPAPPPPVGSGLQNLHVTLTAAQINSATVTGVPIELIPAQGPNLLIVPLFYVAQYNFVSVPYTGTASLDPFIGLGSTLADVLNSYVASLDNGFLKQNFNTIQCAIINDSLNHLDPALFVNKPLLWADDNGADGTGDGTVTLNIPFFVLNVVTGKIVNGQPKRIFGNKVELSTSIWLNAATVPIQLIAAPGANKIIVPMTLVQWSHFHTAPFNLGAVPNAGYGTASADILNTPIFRTIDSNGVKLLADSMAQNPSAFASQPTTLPAKVINQPLSWVNTNDIVAATGDPTSTVYMQYLVIDTVTGELLEGGGDLQNTITQLSASQIKNAAATAPPVGPAPSAGKLNVTWYGVGQYNFVTTAYNGGNGGVPSPRVNPGPASPVYLTALVSFNNNMWSSVSNQMFLAQSNSYQAPNSIPGSEVPPAQVIAQPLSWGNFGDRSASTADGTATVNIQYLVLDTTTGAIDAV